MVVTNDVGPDAVAGVCRTHSGRWQGAASKLALAAVVALTATACVDSSRNYTGSSLPAPGAGSPDPGGDASDDDDEQQAEFTTAGMLENIVDAVILPNYASLRESTVAFAADDGPIAQYCDTVGSDDESASLSGAQDAWRETMATAQAAEMHVFGPAEANAGALRKRVLSYADATLSTCGVDLAVVLAADDAAFDIQSRSLNQRGLGAIEYLLFNDDDAHTCAPQVPGTATWNDLPTDERRLARCNLARHVATDVAIAAAELADAWDGEYRDTFLAEDASSEALQLLTDGLFALDLLVKDRKLGVPTGIHDDCSAAACPSIVESPYSQHSLANVRANVVAFQALFEGADGFGFDDYIAAEDYPEVSERFRENTVAALEYLDGIETPLLEQVAAIAEDGLETDCLNAFSGLDLQAELSACTLTGLVKRVTDDLKIDFVTIVGVSLPGSAQTDND